jgi:hypothetical protein
VGSQWAEIQRGDSFGATDGTMTSIFMILGGVSGELNRNQRPEDEL